MNIVHLNIVRRRRAQEQSLALVRRIASALLCTYAVQTEFNLAAYMGYEPELSNEAAMARWISECLASLDQPIADAIFPVLCDRFQSLLTRMPSHMQGGLS